METGNSVYVVEYGILYDNENKPTWWWRWSKKRYKTMKRCMQALHDFRKNHPVVRTKDMKTGEWIELHWTFRPAHYHIHSIEYLRKNEKRKSD